MGRYLCQMCWSIVHYGEKHPCFFYKDDGEVYTVPPPNEPEEMEGMHEETQETHSGSCNENHLHICAAAQTNRDEESKERNSFLFENYEGISLVPASRRKRRRCSMFPSFRGITGTNMDSDCASNKSNERDNNKDGEKKSKGQRKRKSASTEATQIAESSSIGMATCSSGLGSVAEGEAENVAGPSRIQTQSLGSENKKPFVCDVCGRDFAKRGYLERHRSTHTGDQRTTCPTCGKIFTYKSRMVIHLRTHTGEKPFPCDICGERFALKKTLEFHVRTHTGEKPLKCDVCGKRFARKDHLESHLRTHTGERPYRCEFCDWDFSQSSHYRRHLKQVHGEERCIPISCTEKK